MITTIFFWGLLQAPENFIGLPDNKVEHVDREHPLTEFLMSLIPTYGPSRQA